MIWRIMPLLAPNLKEYYIWVINKIIHTPGGWSLEGWYSFFPDLNNALCKKDTVEILFNDPNKMGNVKPCEIFFLYCPSFVFLWCQEKRRIWSEKPYVCFYFSDSIFSKNQDYSINGNRSNTLMKVRCKTSIQFTCLHPLNQLTQKKMQKRRN